MPCRRFEPPVMGGGDEPFRIGETFVKQRPSCAWTIASVPAAERAHARLTGRTDIARVVVETYRIAERRTGTGEHQWHPRTRETADHSIPYVVATVLHEGTLTPESFDRAHLSDPRLQALRDRIEVVKNDEFTALSSPWIGEDGPPPVLERLWSLDAEPDMAAVPPLLAI